MIINGFHGGGASLLGFRQGFTLAEMMVVLLILSIILAAFAPIMTTRSKSATKDSYWRSDNGGAQIYYGTGDNNMVLIGNQKTPAIGENARLIINTIDDDKQNHILFKRNGTLLGALRLDSSNLLMGGFNRTNFGGTGNTSFGLNALSKNITGGNNNTAIGYNALRLQTAGIQNTAVGYNALAAITTGIQNTAVGYNSLSKNIGSNNNAALGSSALANNTAAGNTAVGHQALFTNTTGSNNTAVGLNTLYTNNASYNTAVGNQALFYNDSGTYNTGLGASALTNNKTGNYNTAVGLNALTANNTSWNTAVGYQALLNNTSGGYNTAVGPDTLNSNQTGQYNIAMGWNALYYNTVSYNTAIGVQALANNASGTNNTAVGYLSIGNPTGGNNNSALGTSACRYVSGSNNTCIGANSGPTTGTIVDNTAWIGGTGTQAVYITGTLYNISGASYQLSSDRRLKNVKDENKSGLEKIKQLKVFNYTLKDDKEKIPHVGVIAQDLQKIFPDAVTKDYRGYLAIRMEDMFYALVNAVKELDAKVSELFKKYIDQQAQINMLEERIKRLEEKSK